MKALGDKTNYYRDYSFREIFNKEKSGNKAITSLYYQHIIQYFLNDAQEYYKLREVINTIIELLPLRKRKKEENDLDLNKKSGIVGDREKTFRKYFSNLVSWQILSNRPTSKEKGSGDTDEYKLTKFGRLLALLIDTKFKSNKESFDALYSFLESYFDDRSYSVYHFCKLYLKKCSGSDLFQVFIKYLIENILYKNNYIENDNDLFTSLIFMRTSNEQLNKRLWNLWHKTFNELDYGLQRLLLYHLKLVLDRRIGETVAAYDPYEWMLLKYRNHYSDITVEYQCINCINKCVSYQLIPILTYLSMIFNGILIEEDINISETDQVKYIQCSECKGTKMRFSMI